VLEKQQETEENYVRRRLKDFSSPNIIRVIKYWPIPVAAQSAVPRLLGLRVRISRGVWVSVSCECCVLSGRGLFVGPITRPEESYRVWGVSECDREASILRRPWHTGGCCPTGGCCAME
jgi:hypothetical protein